MIALSAVASKLENDQLHSLLTNQATTEILFNGFNHLWIEQEGKLSSINSPFCDEDEYFTFIEKVLFETGGRLEKQMPSFNGKWGAFRYCIIGPWVSQSGFLLSLRRHPENNWTLQKLLEAKWCSPSEELALQNMIQSHESFLLVGPTGAGKTSVLNALMCAQPESPERWIIIEDTDELRIPNSASAKLLTRQVCDGNLRAINQSDLLKQALRLRPDRILMGEIRGEEAKDFLMAISTGHKGSGGSLHAEDAHQAILRLEMLVQIAAPQWNLESIRRLLRLALNKIVVTQKGKEGRRKLGGIYEIVVHEKQGLILDQIH